MLGPAKGSDCNIFFKTLYDLRFLDMFRKWRNRFLDICDENYCPALQARRYQHYAATHMKNNVTPVTAVTSTPALIPSGEFQEKESELTHMSPKTQNYRNDLSNEIKCWFDTLPILENKKDSSEIGDKLETLIIDIQALQKEMIFKRYKQKLEFSIKKFFYEVPMWYEGTDKNQRDLTKDLMDRILAINNKFLKDNIELNKKRISGATSDFDTDVNEIVKVWVKMSGFDDRDILPITEIVKTANRGADKKIFNLLVNKKGNHKFRKRYIEKCIHNLMDILDYEKHKFKNVSGCYLIIPQNSTDLIKDTIVNEANIFNLVEIFLDNFVPLNDEKIITDIIFKNIDSLMANDDNNLAVMEIANVLMKISCIPIFICLDIASKLLIYVKHNLDLQINEQIIKKSIKTNNLNDNDVLVYPVTSTPIRAKEKEVQKLSIEELQYIDDLSKLIKAWMDTLPENFDRPEEIQFKDLMITDLAGHITDLFKLEQISPASIDDIDVHLQNIIYRWLLKLNVLNIEEVLPQLYNLVDKIKEMPRPNLTKPHRGGRQQMDQIKFMEGDTGYKESYVPKAGDILEDEISIWVDDLPNDLIDVDKSELNNRIHSIAEALKSKLDEKRRDSDIKTDLANWLKGVLKKNKMNEIPELAENLKNRIITLPRDETLAEEVEEKKRVHAEKEVLRREMKNCKKTYPQTDDTEYTMRGFIQKFIDHNYDVDDPMARGAFSLLLKRHLQRLDETAQQELDCCPTMANKYEEFSPVKLLTELDYIKMISDWLKTMPIDPEYNAAGNKDRAEFVIDLAKTIYEVEAERKAQPCKMDFDVYLLTSIQQFLSILPLTVDKRDKFIDYEIAHLVCKIINYREKEYKNETFDTSGINTDNIGDFIEEFVKINGNDIDDEVKMEAWCVRLLREIIKMIRDSPEPEKITKGEVYEKLENVSIPGDESIEIFNLELEYIAEITEWMKHLPLLPLTEEEKQNRIAMISELAEVMSGRGTKYNETEFNDYVTEWIKKLPLENDKEIIYPILIQQLINRMEKLKQNDVSTEQTIIKPQTCIKLCATSKRRFSIEQTRNPSKWIIDSIKKWSSSLPIKADTPEETAALKENINNTLYQKLGDYNLDPKLTNDDLLYEQIITDEVDTIMNSLPQSKELDEKRDKLKSEITRTLMEGRTLIKEKSAGDNYKHKLENTIEASLPKPACVRREYDPGFEIYKHRLADMFILENFDHTSDEVKEKYGRMIKQEIDKYFDSVKNKNPVPLSNDEIYNELYSALFQVPVPSETSTADEVEEIKTRCVIDTWFEGLPLREATDLNEQLEWDNILATLAKRIHEIEKEPKSDGKIYKEINKWLVKLPIVHEQCGDMEQFAKKLQKALKATTKQRVCVKAPKDLKSVKSKTKGKGKTSSKTSIKDNEKLKNRVPWTSNDRPGKAGEIVLELVKAWANNVPVLATTPEEVEQIKRNLVTNIMIKISELNLDPAVLNNDLVYNEKLDEEIDKQFSIIPFCCIFDDDHRTAVKLQLKGVVDSVKPLIRDEQDRCNYKKKLNETVDNILEKPEVTDAAKEAEYIALRDDIIDNFVQMNYDRDDEEGRLQYRAKIEEAVVKYLTNINNKEKLDPLIKRNQLICELSKVPLPKEAKIQEEIEEIRMKGEINEFFDEIGVKGKKDKPIDRIKMSLTKKVTEIEATGHSAENDKKIQQEINKSLRKLNKDCKPEQINKFIDRLKANESIRKSKVVNPLCSPNCRKKKDVKCKGTSASEFRDSSTYVNNWEGNNSRRQSKINIEYSRRQSEVQVGPEYCGQDTKGTKKDKRRYASEEDCFCVKKFKNGKMPYCLMKQFLEESDSRCLRNSQWCGMPFMPMNMMPHPFFM